MNWTTLRQLLGIVWLSFGGILAVPLLLALWLGEPWLPFALASATALVGGRLMMFRLASSERSLGHREAFLTVSLVWFSICAIGSIPFASYPAPQISWVDALFESVSGFTTTGATVLSGLDGLPKTLLLWRSITQWLGGMGIVIFGVAILPLLGVGGMQLYKAEAPGPTKEKMTPRIAETAKLLWALYMSLTVATAVLFLVDGMPVFDAINHAMTAISTGGFSTHDLSLGYYDSRLIHFAATLAMLAGGTSFAVLHRLATSGPAWSDQPELRGYVGVFLLATALLTADLMLNMGGRYPDFLTALEHGAFQAASILTTTGYSSQDFGLWPGSSQAVLLGLFFIGGMAGSTSGGPKVIRVLLLIRVATRQFFTLLHKHVVDVVRLGNASVDDRVLASSLGFVAIWIILVCVGTVALAGGGADLVTSFSTAASSLGNIGPGFGAAGPSHTFEAFSSWSKFVSGTLMILGRLEIYTVLIVLTPAFWNP